MGTEDTAVLPDCDGGVVMDTAWGLLLLFSFACLSWAIVASAWAKLQQGLIEAQNELIEEQNKVIEQLEEVVDMHASAVKLEGYAQVRRLMRMQAGGTA